MEILLTAPTRKLTQADNVFAIVDSEDFYRMLVVDFDDFCADPTSSRAAVHCAISAYHMVDWVWGDWLKNDGAVRAKMGIGKCKTDFLNWIDNHSVWFKFIQGIANGSKHFAPQNFRTELMGGYGQGPFGVGPFGNPYLLVDFGIDLPMPSGIRPPELSWRSLSVSGGTS